MKQMLISSLLIAGMIAVINSCGLFKQTVKTTDLVHQDSTAILQVRAAAEKEIIKRSLLIQTKKDSALGTYLVKLWPKGKFSFSADKGFEGEADSLIAAGQFWEFEDHSEILDSAIVIKEKESLKLNEEISKSSGQEIVSVRSFGDYKLIIGVLILLFFALYIIFRR